MDLYSLHLFAGAGGGILADKLAGIVPIGAVEIDGFCRDILLQRQADGRLSRFPIWDDVRTFRRDNPDTASFIDRLRQIRDRLVIAGGFPCQDISAANRSATGIAGARSGLWKEFARIIGEIEPRYCFIENSPMLLSRGLETVLFNLSAMGYYVAWGIVSAQSVGAPHLRRRFWAAATKADKIPDALRLRSGRDGRPQQIQKDGRADGGRAPIAHFRGGGNVKPGVLRMADGLSDWLDANRTGTLWKRDNVAKLLDPCPNRCKRLKAVGNAQVPLQAATAFETLKFIVDEFRNSFSTLRVSAPPRETNLITSNPQLKTMQTPEQNAIEQICDKLKETLISKNEDYGSSAFQPPVLAPNLEVDTSILVRMSDKIERIKNLRQADPEKETHYESLRDTVLDLAGYCVLYLVTIQNDEWLKK